MSTLSPRLILADSDVQSITASSLSLYAHSNDTIKFRLFNGKPNPMTLTGYQVGIHLYKTANSVFRRPTAYTNTPSTTGVTVVSATEGIVTVELQATDMLAADIGTAFTMNLYASKFPVIATSTTDTDGDLAAGAWEFKVTAIVGGVETSCQASASVTLVAPNDAVDLTWSAVTGATDYRIYARKDAGTWSYAALGAPGTSYNANTTASFNVTADPPTEDFAKFLLATSAISVK